MPLVTMKEILVNARKDGYAAGAFEFWSLDSAQAVTEAASSLGMPVILQAGPLECGYAGGSSGSSDISGIHKGLDKLSKIAKMVADEVPVPVALHFDHAEELEIILGAIDAGFTSVMMDASKMPYRENVEITKKVVKAAKPYNVTVEAELGRLEGIEGKVNAGGEETAQTDPDEAAAFVKETGIDALAVAIGTAHGLYRFPPRINIDRLKKIAAKVSIPLVLHGGSGTPDNMVVEAIRCGIAKVNICTEFVIAFGTAYTETQRMNNFKYSVPALFNPSKQRGKELAELKIKLFSIIK